MINNNKYTLVLDSSQISNFLECPEQWHNKYVKRLIPTFYEIDRSAMNAGTYGHNSHIYYRMRSKLLPLNEAMQAAFAYEPDSDTCECGCEAIYHKAIEALKIVECQKCKHCLKFRPHPFDLSPDARSTVRARLRDYFAKYQNSDFQATSENHVEVVHQ